MALEEFETNEKLSPAERNKIILQLIDRFYPKEKLDFLNKSIQDRFILLQNESHLLNE